MMNSKFYNITHIFIPVILVVAIISAISLYNIKYDEKRNDGKRVVNQDNSVSKENQKEVDIDAISSFLEKNKITNDDLTKIKINKKYTSISYSAPDRFISEIIITKYKEKADIIDLVNEGKEEEFKNLINEQINIKYPSFIANELIKDSTIYYYEFLDNGIVIHFDNYNTNPIYEEKTTIKLTCGMINGLIDYTCLVDSEENPNIIKLDSSKKTVALTFDDGPNKNTLSILDTLKENHASATFFMVGTNINNFSDTVKRVSIEGHEIGSHTYSHKSLLHVKNEALEKEVNEVSNLVKNITGNDVKLLRPPYGSINGEIRNKYPYSYIMWSVDPEDWKYKDATIVREHVLDEVEDGDIILLHDIHFTTAESLKLILPELYIRGYQVVSVTKLAELKGQNLVPNNIYRSFK